MFTLPITPIDQPCPSPVFPQCFQEPSMIGLFSSLSQSPASDNTKWG